MFIINTISCLTTCNCLNDDVCHWCILLRAIVYFPWVINISFCTAFQHFLKWSSNYSCKRKTTANWGIKRQMLSEQRLDWKKAVTFLWCFQIKSSVKYVGINYSGRSIRWKLLDIWFYITSYYLHMQIQYYKKSEIRVTKLTNQLLVWLDSKTLSLKKLCLLWAWGFWRPLTFHHQKPLGMRLFLRVSHVMFCIVILWVVAAFVSFAKVPLLKNE